MSKPPEKGEDALVSTEERFRLLIDSVRDYAIFMLDPRGHVATWNAGAERFKQYRAEEIIGHHFSRFCLEEEVRAGKCEHELEVAAREGRFEDEGWRVRKDGSRFWANVIITALRDRSGELVGFAKVTRDLTERRAAEEARLKVAEERGARESAERVVRLMTRLQSLATALAGARAPEDVIRVLVAEGASAVGAAISVFVEPRDGSLEIVATHELESERIAQWQRFPADGSTPLGEAFRTRQPQWIDDEHELTSRYPNLGPVPAHSSTATLPLVVGDRVLGVLGFRFDRPRQLWPEERSVVQAMAAQAAEALDRTQGHQRELMARRSVELLGQLAAALSAALSVRDVARVVVDRGMAAMSADTCVLYGFDDTTQSFELITEHGCSPEIVDQVRRIPPDSLNPFHPGAMRGEFAWIESGDEYARVFPTLAHHAGSGPRARAFWSGPLVAEGRTIGLLGMGFYEDRTFPEAERDFVVTFTRQCAEALLRAQRLEAESAAKALAERLQASLSATLRSIGDAVIATDAAGSISVINIAAEKITGWTDAEARGRPLLEVFRVVDENTREVLDAPLTHVVQKQRALDLSDHTLLVPRAGRAVAIECNGAPMRGERGNVEGAVFVFRDVTAKKQDEHRRAFLTEAMTSLAESLDYEATLKRVAHLAVPRWADWCAIDMLEEGHTRPRRLAVAHVDPAKIRFAQEIEIKYPPNPDATSGTPHVLRTGQSELYSEIPDELLVASAIDEEHLRLARELQLRSAMIVPLVARERVLGAMSFVFAESGRSYGEEDLRFAEELARRCGIAIDNARLYASEQRARQAADVANRAKDEFLAMVSHELRTPLNAIMGWAKLMSAPGADEARRARAIDTIERNAVAMAQLVEDLLDMSRIISGKMRLEVQPVALVQVIEAALESVQPAADAKGITLAPVLDTTVPALMGDPTRLQQVVWNLLSNAVKFTPRGGRVHVVLRFNGSSAEVSVTDTGKGIAPRFLPHVFDPFRQEDASYTRSHGGLGLGLAITRQLVELHGGSIAAHSEGEGLGATFTLTLPIAMVNRFESGRPASASYPATYQKPEQLVGLDVLVVDDEDDARELATAILGDCGCRVRVARTVREAMAAFAAAIPDVLVSDVGMPEEDGFALIQRVRSLPTEAGGDVPAAAVTAFARAEDRLRLLQAGYSMHVTKPVVPAELVAVVASLAQFRRRPRAS